MIRESPFWPLSYKFFFFLYNNRKRLSSQHSHDHFKEKSTQQLEENKKFYITSKYAKTHFVFYHFSNTFWNKIATNYWWPINNPCRCIFCQYISIFRHIKTGWKNFKNSNFEIPTFWPILCQKTVIVTL